MVVMVIVKEDVVGMVGAVVVGMVMVLPTVIIAMLAVRQVEVAIATEAIQLDLVAAVLTNVVKLSTEGEIVTT